MKACLFCGVPISAGSGGNKAAEHAFPKWLQRRLSALGKQFESVQVNLVTGEQESRTHPLLTLVAKDVCRTCNQGWMSGLETAFVPIFEKLIQPGCFVTDLSDDESQVVRRWAFKTALAVVAACPTDKQLPEMLYRSLAQGQPIPHGIHVFGGSVGGHQLEHGLYVGDRLGVIPCHATRDDADRVLRGTTWIVIQASSLLLVVYWVPNQFVKLAPRPGIHHPIGIETDAYTWMMPLEVLPQPTGVERLWDEFARNIFMDIESATIRAACHTMAI